MVDASLLLHAQGRGAPKQRRSGAVALSAPSPRQPAARKAASMEARLVRLTPVELEGYLARLADITRVVRWNGVPVALEEAVRRAEELGELVGIAAQGPDVFVTAE